MLGFEGCDLRFYERGGPWVEDGEWGFFTFVYCEQLGISYLNKRSRGGYGIESGNSV